MLIAQITDLHVRESVDFAGHTVDTLESAGRAVEHLNALSPRPDGVIVTGDLVAEVSRENYESVATVLNGLLMPSYVIPGNHDNRTLMREVFGAQGYLTVGGEFLHYTIENSDLRLIALDTHDPGKDSGLMCRARLSWLDQRLSEAAHTPTLVAMHHPPCAVGIPEFEVIGLCGADALGEIIARNAQVKAIACGHVHRDIVSPWCGTLVAVTPSTGYQYGLKLTEGPGLAKVPEPPATRLFHWSPTAGLACHISYIPSSSGILTRQR